MSLEGFKILAKLGDGSYSSVYKVLRKEDNVEYALKKVKIQNLSDREKENALNEVRILASIKNPFISSYKEAFFDENSSSLCIIMEYADDGDVFQRICECQNNKQFMKEKHIWKIVIQVVRGLQTLHDLKILHRDMKSANIFLYKDTTAKLGDLNVSKVAKKGLLYTQTGTPYYASPEVWKDQPYDLKSDIWSLGCVIYEMCALVPPFRAEDMNGLFKRVLKGQYPPIPSHYSMDMRQLIKTLLAVDAAQRPNCDGILSMPIIQKRMRKYFGGKEESQSGTKLADLTTNDFTDSELLRTIKLSKNLFKMKLPKATYEANFQTIPGPTALKAHSRAQQRMASHVTDGSEETEKKEARLPRISKAKPSDTEGTDAETTKITNKRGEASVEGPRISGDGKPKQNRSDKRSKGEMTPGNNRNKNSELNASQSEARVQRGLNQSPSVSSLHEPAVKQSRKNSRIMAQQPINEYDEYADEVTRVTRPSDSSKGKSKNTQLVEQQEHLANRIQEKRMPRILESQSVMENHNQSRLGVANSSKVLNGSPSAISLSKVDANGDHRSSSKKRVILGVNYNNNGGQQLTQSQSNQQLPVPNSQTNNYKRIVNIYSLNNNGNGAGQGLNSIKRQRKSQAPDQRLYLNHSLIPPGGMPPQNNKYGDSQRRSPSIENLQLPALQNVRGQQPETRQHYNQYNQGVGSMGRPYHYKSTLENQNSAMISKLLSRKRSYERMMHVDDGQGGSMNRGQQNHLMNLANMPQSDGNLNGRQGIPVHNSVLDHNKKSRDILLSVGKSPKPRGLEPVDTEPYGLQSNSSLKKPRPQPMPSYLDSTPQNQRVVKPARGNRVIPVNGSDRSFDGVTGNKLGQKTEQKQSVVSGQRLRGSNSAVEL